MPGFSLTRHPGGDTASPRLVTSGFRPSAQPYVMCGKGSQGETRGLPEAVRNADGRPMRAHERRFPIRSDGGPHLNLLGRGAPDPEGWLMKRPTFRIDVRLTVNVAACLWAIAAIIHAFH